MQEARLSGRLGAAPGRSSGRSSGGASAGDQDETRDETRNESEPQETRETRETRQPRETRGETPLPPQESGKQKAESAALITGLIGAIQSYAEDALCAGQLVSRDSARDSSEDFTRDFDLDAKFGSLFQGLADAVRTTGHWHAALFSDRAEGGLFPVRLYDAEGRFQFSQLCQMVGGRPKAFQTPHLRALLEELQSAKLYFKSHARAQQPQQNDPETLRREGARLMALSLRQKLRHHHEPPFAANDASRRQVLDLLD